MQEDYSILIAEDSRTQSIELQYLLEKSGYKTFTAYNGKEALEILKDTVPDIIITDIVMPEMDGYELCAAVRAEERTRNIPVVLLTSLSSADHVIEGLKCGADNFITKPFDQEALLARISYILLNKKLRQSQSASLGLNLFFDGKAHTITAERTQILDLFFSSFETAMQKHRQLEEKIRELRETQEYLKKAKEQAEASMREAEKAKAARGMFLANVTHDLRTPLNAVIGIADILAQNTKQDTESKEYLTVIKNAGECLLAQINNILDFSKIDAGMLDIEEMDFDVYELVNITASIFTKQVVDKNITLDVDIAPDVPHFLIGDEARLRQIFINLIGNAVKYTFEGTVGFSVKRINNFNDPGKVKLQFDVSDTGIGIPEDKQDCLFQAFVQAEKSSARIYGGTGLGLAIVKQLTNKMGGTVTLKSKPGVGSTFTIVLELPVSSKTSIEKCKEKFHQTIPENKLIKALNPNNVNGKILVVEDSKVNLQITCSLLDKFGCEYEVASNGLEAVDLFRREGGNFKLILMDYHMPIMDGYDAAVEIRKIESQNNSYTPVPIIALTASGSYADRKKCSEAGMNGFLEKPFNKEQVEHCLEKWLTTFKQTAL